MSNSFLQDFANLLISFTPSPVNGIRLVSETYVQRELEVMKAMMEQVRLKKENYVSLMKGLKAFIDCP